MTPFEIIGYVGYVAGAIVILQSKVKNDNINDLQQRVTILEKERSEAQNQHVQNQKAISNLEGQLATYKDIPLKQISASLEHLVEDSKTTASTNKEILATLKGSAELNKEEKASGGLLVKTDPSKPVPVKETRNGSN